MMDRIVREAESHFFEWGTEQTVLGFEHGDAASMARAAQALANDKNVTAVACFTTQGRTAWLMSKIRPRVPVMAFTPDPKTYSRLTFIWGVRPQQVRFANSLEEMIDFVDSALMHSDVVQPGRPGRTGVRIPGGSRPPIRTWRYCIRWGMVDLLRVHPDLMAEHQEIERLHRQIFSFFEAGLCRANRPAPVARWLPAS
ncbi:MAG: hypothetical protein M0C28_34300 [Candidatus Moduliflexus flocculans]|nr:hypothetical protein [Candidatus Moduliflexus flocculans]